MAITRNNNQILVDGKVVFFANSVHEEGNPMGISIEKKEECINKVLNIEKNEARLKSYRDALLVFSEALPQFKEKIEKILSI